MTMMFQTFRLFLALFLPLGATYLIYFPSIIEAAYMSVMLCALALLMLSTQRLPPILKTCSLFALVSLYLLMLVTSVFEFGLYDFTGQGLIEEVLFHFEPQSIKIAWIEYPFILSALSLALVGLSWLLVRWVTASKTKIHGAITLLAMLGLIFCLPTQPLGRLFNTLQQYLGHQSQSVDPALIEQFKSLQIIQTDKPSSQLNFTAKHTTQSKNLILVYLESFNAGLTNHPKYPGLTPNINALKNEFTYIESLTSSYVTIEGIIASQCGIMLPMGAGNNTFLNNGQLMGMMPCLGDVLKRAGYQQHYLGGAAMEFAGKGTFLSTHGYDEIKGWEYWQEAGFPRHEGGWGLSDAILFDQAVQTIKEAAKNPPYNVTLLNLGTHLPGYQYQGCQDYQNFNEPFLDAVHCTDHLIGQFVEALRAEALLDDAVLMIVADHGIFPTPKMTELFGELVADKKLLTLINQPIDVAADTTMGGYDLAPTLLDLMAIDHNVSFMYGQSIFTNNKSQQQYVTRYLDWHEGHMVGNQPETCEKNMTWPLNGCHKKALIDHTNEVIRSFSIKESKEPIHCQFDAERVVQTEKEKTKVQLIMDGVDHYPHFYHKGYLLNSLKLHTGLWGFALDDQQQIISHHYFPDNRQGLTEFQQHMSAATHDHLWLAFAKDQELQTALKFTNSESLHHAFVKAGQSANMAWMDGERVDFCQ